jgi:hypothetical protein
MFKSLLVPVILLALTGCTRVSVYMKQSGDVGGPDYVIVKIKARKDVVYDCVSNPQEGAERDPTCVKVTYRTAAKAAEAKADKRADAMGE